MPFSFQSLHPHFVAEAIGPDLREVFGQETLSEIRGRLDQYGVLVFRNQPFSNEEQLAFAQRFDGTLHTTTSLSVLTKNRFDNEGLTDISNVTPNGELMARDDRRRANTLGNRLWHTDASFVDPVGRYSMLSARVVPSVRADTEFADMRAAYDALNPDLKISLKDLTVYHSIVYSRQVLGFEFNDEEKAKLKGAAHSLVRVIPPSGRRSLYLASHASHIVGWPVPEGRMLLRDLIEHATQLKFTYAHAWRKDDFVIWDNRATMHRGRSFDDIKYRRELCRTTTLDLEKAPAV